ncbi:MAG: hypothetical protein AB7S92_06520 [Parvibaculaceae bacterium]
MSRDPVTVILLPEHFTPARQKLATCGGMTAEGFRYASGVASLTITNDAGHIELLPFHGQQIWDAMFFGRRLTMGSMFDEPLPTQDYLSNYGAFFIHCGVTAMGNPGAEDTHPLHGELPNAVYREARLVIGEDGDGPFMGLAGTYRHRVAFTHHYMAEPFIKLPARGGRIQARLAVRNLRKLAAMELMYLAHINFRPIDNARLIDTAPDDPRHMRVRASLPIGYTPSAGHRQLLDEMLAEPARHRRIVEGRAIDPELVLSLDCRADEAGFAHSMQLLPDGTADFVSHRPDELDHGVRWLSRSGDQDALGLMLPATADPNGYTAEKARGHLRILPPQGEFHCALEFGALGRNEAEDMRRRIAKINDGAGAEGTAP